MRHGIIYNCNIYLHAKTVTTKVIFMNNIIIFNIPPPNRRPMPHTHTHTLTLNINHSNMKMELVHLNMQERFYNMTKMRRGGRR